MARLQGRPVKVGDGSSVQLPDTADNQKAYPQPSGQKPGCGFPVLKLVGLFSLASGALLDVVMGNRHRHDRRLLRPWWAQLKAGDILLGDRAYGDYVTLAGLPPQGVAGVARWHQARKVAFRKARRLGPNDGVFVWHKGGQQSSILTPRGMGGVARGDSGADRTLHGRLPGLPVAAPHPGHHLARPRKSIRRANWLPGPPGAGDWSYACAM